MRKISVVKQKIGRCRRRQTERNNNGIARSLSGNEGNEMVFHHQSDFLAFLQAFAIPLLHHGQACCVCVQSVAKIFGMPALWTVNSNHLLGMNERMKSNHLKLFPNAMLNSSLSVTTGAHKKKQCTVCVYCFFSDFCFFLFGSVCEPHANHQTITANIPITAWNFNVTKHIVLSFFGGRGIKVFCHSSINDRIAFNTFAGNESLSR